MIKRRDALKRMGALAGAPLMGKFLSACGGDDGGDDGPVGITTMVVLMMENRSYDHWFGARSMLDGKPGDGLVSTMSNPDRLGSPAGLWTPPISDQECVIDPPHGWDASHAAFNGGANDGFVVEHQNSHDTDTDIGPMQYLTREHIPASWAIADKYVSCDRYFCSVMGPTWPNRMYWHAASSNGIKTNDLPTNGFDWPSIYHRLHDKGVPYAYYYGDVPVIAVLDDLPGLTESIYRMEEFFQHAAAGTLAPVVYIDPAFSMNDDHPPHHPILGQQLIASIYTALAASPQWKNCMFVVTYDEHGGFFDHVAPPTTVDDLAADGFDQMGFRVPTMIAGPYIKKGEVISTQYEHCSVLRHIENMFDLEPLNQRTMASNDLTDCIDMERLAAGAWEPAAEIPAIEVDESIITDACQFMNKVSHPMLDLADQRRDVLARWDRRGKLQDYIYTIGDFLEMHNAGRIRRGK
ncbi:MAG: alkaline phosphatase family protein [Kofleriaceae bacterium]|nr:alkaline phosphatase family protein [Kofleriaceae bacterium]